MLHSEAPVNIHTLPVNLHRWQVVRLQEQSQKLTIHVWQELCVTANRLCRFQTLPFDLDYKLGLLALKDIVRLSTDTSIRG